MRDPRAYLVRIVTRQALNRLRSLARRREDYVGEWLPEPLLTSPDVAADVELAESVSIAMLTVLETLGPAERAVFVLREVFDTPYDEIAEAVGKSPAAVRQIAHRARDHVAARRPRMPVSTTEQQEAVDRFLAAVRHGDLQGLLDVLAPDVVVVADGGGLVAAARRPIEGAERVAGFLIRRSPLGGLRGEGRLAQRVTRHPARHRRAARHRREPRRRERAHHPHLRHPQPTQARPTRRGRRSHTDLTLRSVFHAGPKAKESRSPRSSDERSGHTSTRADSCPYRGQRDAVMILDVYVRRQTCPVQFSADLRDRVANGKITVSFRLWSRPKVKVGGLYRSGPVMIEIDDIELLPFSSITDDDLAWTGEPDLESLRQRAAHAGPIDDDTLVFRVEFHVVKPTRQDALT